MTTRDEDTRTDGWRIVIPWLLLPAALAVITLVDWLRRRRRPLE